MNTKTDTQAHDRELASELMAHHAVMVEELDKLTNDLLKATGNGAQAKETLIEWVHSILLPHAAEEEATTYAAAAALPQGAALIDSMIREHQTIIALAVAFHSIANTPEDHGHHHWPPLGLCRPLGCLQGLEPVWTWHVRGAACDPEERAIRRRSRAAIP